MNDPTYPGRVAGAPTVPTPKPGVPSTADTLQQLLDRYKTNAVMLAGMADVPLRDLGGLPSVAGARFLDITAQQGALEKQLDQLGFDPKTLGGSKQTADSAAATGVAYARIAADRELAALADKRERELTAANNDAAAARAQATSETSARVAERGQNADSVIHLLDNEIARGNMSLTEASTKLRGATDAANLQRDVLKDWGGLALPPGTESFPGFGPGGAISKLGAALGFPGLNIPTGGQFNVSPSGMAQPIVNAANAVPNASAGVGNAFARAIAALTTLGVPADPRVGRPPGMPAGTAALAGMAG